MIRSIEDLFIYLEMDRLALCRRKVGLRQLLFRFASPDYVWDFQILLRKLEYYNNMDRNCIFSQFKYFYYRFRFKSVSLKLGFTIPINVFGPGLAVVHYGSIVVNENARIGANCRIHVGTNIGASGGSDKAPRIGDNVYIAPGAKIFGDIEIASNIAIGANAVVNRSFIDGGVLIAGIPARVIKEIDICALIPHLIKS
jgi:serine O-acetyltransferase